MPENNAMLLQVMQRYTAYAPLSGVDQKFIAALLNAFEGNTFSASDFDQFPIELIVEYIERTHIFYLQTKLPEIEQSILLLSEQYTSHHPILTALQNFFHLYCQDLTAHIQAEETKLLPYIALLRRSADSSHHFTEYVFVRAQYSVARFLADHHDTEDELKDIRQTIRLYEPPATNASLYRILLTQLQNFEKDLCVHACIEDQVLIPRVLQMEKKLDGRVDRITRLN